MKLIYFYILSFFYFLFFNSVLYCEWNLSPQSMVLTEKNFLEEKESRLWGIKKNAFQKSQARMISIQKKGILSAGDQEKEGIQVHTSRDDGFSWRISANFFLSCRPSRFPELLKAIENSLFDIDLGMIQVAMERNRDDHEFLSWPLETLSFILEERALASILFVIDPNFLNPQDIEAFQYLRTYSFNSPRPFEVRLSHSILPSAFISVLVPEEYYGMAKQAFPNLKVIEVKKKTSKSLQIARQMRMNGSAFPARRNNVEIQVPDYQDVLYNIMTEHFSKPIDFSKPVSKDLIVHCVRLIAPSDVDMDLVFTQHQLSKTPQISLEELGFDSSYINFFLQKSA